MNILCENIRALRRERGMTQKELAEQLNISDKTVSRWESGVQLPEASLLPMLAQILGVSIDSLYGLETPEKEDETPLTSKKEEAKNLLHFKIWMIVGMLTSLMGSLIYRYFDDAVFMAPNLVDAEYYQTTKGATADLLSFVGIIAVFVGICMVIIAKVRYTMQNRPHMSDPAFATDARYTGAAILVCVVIFLKTAPEMLSLGFFMPRTVYGDVFVALLTGVLLWYRHQLTKRGFITSKKVMIVALVIGIIGIALSITAVVMRETMTVATAFSTEIADSASSGASFSSMASGVAYAGTIIAVADWIILAAPVILYIEQLIKLRKVQS